MGVATAATCRGRRQMQTTLPRRGRGMRRPNKAHTCRPWRIHEVAGGFRVEDVWALPTPGGPDDFPLLVELIAHGRPSRHSSRAARALWAIRLALGSMLGWDKPDTGLGHRVSALRDRLPIDLRNGSAAPDVAGGSFTSLYLLHDEWAAEMANKTVHGVLHVGWVEDGTGGYHGQLAVLVKPNGLFGYLYMAAIRPFRHLIVYPATLRTIEHTWRKRTGQPAATGQAHPFSH
jgi:Protein of unknown function (DUF2867)